MGKLIDMAPSRRKGQARGSRDDEAADGKNYTKIKQELQIIIYFRRILICGRYRVFTKCGCFVDLQRL